MEDLSTIITANSKNICKIFTQTKLIFICVFCCISQILKKIFCKIKDILHEILQEFGHVAWLIYGLNLFLIYNIIYCIIMI